MRYYTSNVSLKAKDNTRCLGQGQVRQRFYFGRTHDLFKPSDPCDLNNILDISASASADSGPSVKVYAAVFHSCVCTPCGACRSVRICRRCCIYARHGEPCPLPAPHLVKTAARVRSCVNQPRVKPRDHSEQQSRNVTVTVFHPSPAPIWAGQRASQAPQPSEADAGCSSMIARVIE